jgi:TonB family protein
MSANKIITGAVTLLVAAGAATVAVQERANARLAAEVSTLQEQTSDFGSLKQENQRLIRTTEAAQSLAEANQTGDALGAKIKALSTESAGLRRQIAAEAARRRAAAAASGATPVQAIDVSKLDQIPVPVFQAPPKYPFDLRVNGVGGQVLVDFIVDKDGIVQNAHAANSTNPEFEQPAIDAVNQWNFNPGQKSGQSVNTHMQVPVVFSVNNAPPSAPPAASSNQPGTVTLAPFSTSPSQPAPAPTDWFPGVKN